MTDKLFSYLSLASDVGESDYIKDLSHQFVVAELAGSYHSALFSYHLIFICYFYQIFHKMKLWLPDKHHLAVVSFSADRRKKFRDATDPTAYVHKGNQESPMFEFLNVFSDCEKVVSRCKKLVKYRNEHLGHVNYLLVSKDEFEKQITEYEEVAELIHRLTHKELAKVFDEYVRSLDPAENLTKDDLELGLIIPQRLSPIDLCSLFAECELNPGTVQEKIKTILLDDYHIDVTLLQ
jgi:hypothetical protein